MDMFLISLTLLMICVIYFDFTSYIIPNWLNALVLVLFGVMALMTGTVVDWQYSFIAFGIVFAAGFFIFAMNWMGGGDVKLLIATAPWVGFSHLLEYILLVAVLGGVLAISIWHFRKITPWVWKVKHGGTLPRILRTGEMVPYGLAIAAAFLYFLWTGNVVGVEAVFKPLTFS